MAISENAGALAIDILRNDFHRPFVKGKANRENIEDNIVIGIMSGQLNYFVNQKIVDAAIDMVDNLIMSVAGADVPKEEEVEFCKVDKKSEKNQK